MKNALSEKKYEKKSTWIMYGEKYNSCKAFIFFDCEKKTLSCIYNLIEVKHEPKC